MLYLMKFNIYIYIYENIHFINFQKKYHDTKFNKKFRNNLNNIF